MRTLEHPDIRHQGLLLRKQAPTELDADGETDDETVPEEEEEKLYCAQCGHLITDGTWRISMAGDHEHTFFNPAGVIFEIYCFKEAPGVFARGRASGEFTWFTGYKWQVAQCTGCAVHMGWKFSGADQPRVFFGLIRSKLTDHRPDA